MIGAPKSEKLTVKTNNKLERIPGIASGSVIKINVNQFFAPRFLDPSSKVISLTRKAATIGHRAYGKKKKTWTIAMPSREYGRSEEHTSELQSRFDLVCRLLLEK